MEERGVGTSTDLKSEFEGFNGVTQEKANEVGNR